MRFLVNILSQELQVEGVMINMCSKANDLKELSLYTMCFLVHKLSTELRVERVMINVRPSQRPGGVRRQ